MKIDASIVEQGEVQEIASVAAAFQRSKLVSHSSNLQPQLDASPTLTPQSSCADLEAARSDVSTITDLQTASEFTLPGWLQNPSRHGRVQPRNQRARMKPAPAVLDQSDVGQHLSRLAGLQAQGDTVLASVHGHTAALKSKQRQRFKTQIDVEVKAVAPNRNANGSTPKANAKWTKAAAPLQQFSKTQKDLLWTSAGVPTGNATVATPTAPPRLAMPAAMPSAPTSPTQLKSAVAAYLSMKQMLELYTLDSAPFGAVGNPQTRATVLAFDMPMHMDVHTVAKSHISRLPPGLTRPPGL